MKELISEASRTVEDSQTAQALHGLLSLKSPERSATNLNQGFTKYQCRGKLATKRSSEIVLQEKVLKQKIPLLSGGTATVPTSLSLEGCKSIVITPDNSTMFKAIKPKGQDMPTSINNNSSSASITTGKVLPSSPLYLTDGSLKFLIATTQSIDASKAISLINSDFSSSERPNANQVNSYQLLATSVGVIALPTQVSLASLKSSVDVKPRIATSVINTLPLTINKKVPQKPRIILNPASSLSQLFKTPPPEMGTFAPTVVTINSLGSFKGGKTIPVTSSMPHNPLTIQVSTAGSSGRGILSTASNSILLPLVLTPKLGDQSAGFSFLDEKDTEYRVVTQIQQAFAKHIVNMRSFDTSSVGCILLLSHLKFSKYRTMFN